jgi:hypothetical protein
MQTFRRYLPWLVLVLGVLYVASALPQTDKAGEFRLAAFAGLPISDHGRIKPIDTYARVELMMMNRRQEFKDTKERTQSAVRWLVNLLGDGMVEYVGSVTLTQEIAEIPRFATGPRWAICVPGRRGHGDGGDETPRGEIARERADVGGCRRRQAASDGEQNDA